MSCSRHTLTPTLQETIVAYVRAGGFPNVAAEAAGVPGEVFADWLRQGEKPRARAVYRDLVEAVRQATAQARLNAEVSVCSTKPLDWLRCGPGKPMGSERPGWTTAAKPTSQPNQERSALEDPEVRTFLAELLAQLDALPEAREKLAEVLTKRP